MIRTLSTPCLVLRDQDQKPPQDDYDPIDMHYANAADAEAARHDVQESASEHFAALQSYRQGHPGSAFLPELLTYTVVALQEACAVLKCDKCGETFECDGVTMHMNPEDIVQAAEECEWHIVDGCHYCGWACRPPIFDDEDAWHYHLIDAAYRTGQIEALIPPPALPPGPSA